jgi:CRP/FNR family transcriptional regulator, cyclic AMP receptor protein
MDLKNILRGVDLFEGLTDQELDRVVKICRERRFSPGEIITKEGAEGNELFIITDGFVEILLGERSTIAARVVVSLGPGQIIGEMALVDQGPRSASVRATTKPTVVQAIQRADLEALFQQETRIGYIIMRNLAADLSFKMRHRNLGER